MYNILTYHVQHINVSFSHNKDILIFIIQTFVSENGIPNFMFPI